MRSWGSWVRIPPGAPTPLHHPNAPSCDGASSCPSRRGGLRAGVSSRHSVPRVSRPRVVDSPGASRSEHGRHASASSRHRGSAASGHAPGVARPRRLWTAPLRAPRVRARPIARAQSRSMAGEPHLRAGHGRHDSLLGRQQRRPRERVRAQQHRPRHGTGITTRPALPSRAGQACAVLADGTVRCWGDNEFGELGNGTEVGSLRPGEGARHRVRDRRHGGCRHTCALLADGRSRAGGFSGMIGDGSWSSRSAPVPVDGIDDGVALAAGWLAYLRAPRQGGSPAGATTRAGPARRRHAPPRAPVRPQSPGSRTPRRSPPAATNRARCDPTARCRAGVAMTRCVRRLPPDPRPATSPLMGSRMRSRSRWPQPQRVRCSPTEPPDAGAATRAGPSVTARRRTAPRPLAWSGLPGRRPSGPGGITSVRSSPTSRRCAGARTAAASSVTGA